MYFRSQRKSSQDVSLSDYIETGSDGAALALMDVVSDDTDLLEQVSTRQALKKLCVAIDTALSGQEKQVIIANQIYYLAMLSYKKLSPEELADFVEKSGELLFDYCK